MMYTRVVLVVVYIGVVFTSSCECQDDGIMISLGDRVIPNHGLVTVQDIGVDPTGTNLAVGLSCSTTSDTCCSDFPHSADPNSVLKDHQSGNGSWLYPSTRFYVPRQVDRPDYIFGISRSENAVYVFRNRDENQLSVIDGIWRCVIPDSRGREQTKYIGVYSNEFSNGTLNFSTPDTIQFSIVSDDPVVFNLTFMTTGGPATYVYWTRDGVSISTRADRRYTTSQIVTNVKLGHYSNILTVSERLPRVYGVTVTNDRTGRPYVTPESVRILDYRQPVIARVSAMQTNNYQDLTIVWTIANSALVSRYFDGYEIQYRRCPSRHQQTSCDNSQPVTVTIPDNSATQYTLYNAIPGSTYQFSVTLSKKLNHYFLPGISGLSTTVQITAQELLVPEITSESVIELANITSVQVTWNQPEGGLAVDEYVVSYHRLNGRNGQCSSFQDGGSVTVNNTTRSVIHLQAYSVYIVNVSARKGALHSMSSNVQFETNSTVPSASTQNVTIINSTSTSVTITWNSVECIHRNGLVTHYNIGHGPADYGETNVVQTRGEPDEGGGSYTFTGLEPSSNYEFKVAAVNDVGVGPFAITQGKTINTIPQLFQLKIGRTDDCITWNSDKAEEIRTNIRTKLLQVIQERCQCKLPEENLFNGVFSCLHSHNQTTYRSYIMGTHLYYDTEIVGFIQDWVNSAPTVTIQWYTVKVDPKCPVGIASLDDPECEPTTNENCSCTAG